MLCYNFPMAMIVRVAPSDAVARLLKRKTEDPDDSVLEFLDQRIELGNYNPEISREIEEETTEKDLSKGRSKDIIKSIEKNKEAFQYAKSDSQGIERN